MQFPPRVMIVKNRHQKPLHPVSHQHQEVEVRREKKKPNRQTPVCEVQRTAVQKLLEKVLALNYFFGVLPDVSSISLKRDVNSEQSAHFRTGSLRNNPTKGRRRVVTKVQ